MNKEERDKWTRSGCEDLIQLGRAQTCNEKWYDYAPIQTILVFSLIPSFEIL